MPSRAFMEGSAFIFFRIAVSGTASMSPAPNTGVGMRKMMLRFPPWPVIGFPAGPKFGWAMLQPAASARPVMTKRLCTAPSGVPSGFRLKRASRIGPLFVMNHGNVFFAPLSVATAIRGFGVVLLSQKSGWPDLDTHSCLAHQSGLISTDGRLRLARRDPERL